MCFKFVLILLITFTQNTWSGDSKLIDAEDARPRQFPSVVSIQKIGALQNFCGGTLLSATHVITSAHCIYKDMSNLIVIAGIINPHFWGWSSQKRFIISAVIHGAYDHKHPEVDNDIAVIILNRQVHFNEFVNPSIPFDEHITIGTPVEIVGFGGEARILQFARAEVSADFECGGSYSESELAVLCIKGTRNITLPLVRRGDSGSPAFFEDKIVGIASKTRLIDDTGAYYTSVPYFKDFIQKALNIRGNGSKKQSYSPLVTIIIVVYGFC